MSGARGLYWLARRETLRVAKLWTQTILAPVVSSMLFIVVFGLSLGDRVRNVGSVDYEVFIVPGLIAMRWCRPPTRTTRPRSSRRAPTATSTTSSLHRCTRGR